MTYRSLIGASPYPTRALDFCLAFRFPIPMALGTHSWLTGLQVLVVFDVIAGRLLHQLLQLPVRQILNFISQTAALLFGQHGLL